MIDKPFFRAERADESLRLDRSAATAAGRSPLRPTRHPTLWYGLLLVLELAVVFAAAEWAASWYLPTGHHYRHPQPIMEPDARRIYSYRANQQAYTIDHPFITNSLALREADEIPPDADGDLRIMALGDSMTAGVGVAAEDTYVKQLETRLKAEGIRGRVVNAGVAGYGTWQELDLLNEKRGAVRPDIVTLQLHWNDLYPRPTEIIPIAGDQSGDRQDAVQRYLRILKRSRVLLFLRERWASFSNTLSPSVDWIHRDMIWRGATNMYVEEAYGDMDRSLREFAALQREGIVPILLIFPMPMQVQDKDAPPVHMQTRLEAMAKRAGLRTVDLLPALRHAYREHSDLYIPWDHEHLTPRGHRVVAEALRQYLVEQHLLSPSRD